MRRTKFIDKIRRTFLTLCLMATATLAWAEAVEVTNADQLASLLTGSDQELKLTADITLSQTLVIKSDVIIDLNGHTITSEGCRAFQVTKGEVLFKSDNPDNPAYIIANGRVPVDNSVIRVGEGGPGGYTRDKTFVNLTIGENVTISTTVETCYGVTVFGNKTEETLIVNGNVNTVGRAAIAGNGLPEYAGTTITVGENAEIKTSSNVAIYHPQSGTLTVNGKVTGAGGIEIKAGKLEVTATAKVTATGALSHIANNNDPSTCGYAIAIVENEKYTAGVSEVKISKDATIEGQIAVVKDSENANTQTVKFTGDMKMSVKVTTEDDKSFGQYQSLELAMSQAPAGAKITLLDKVETTSTIETSKNYTLDLNGKTITSDGHRALWVKSGEVTIKSTAAGGKIDVPTCDNNDLSAIRVGSNESAAATLTIAEGVTISADECYGITVFGTNTTETLTVNGNVNTKIRPAISGNGSAGFASTDITIGSTANITTSDEVAIYQPQAGTLTVYGKVTGAGGIEIKGGSLDVKSGAEITVPATSAPAHTPNNDGTSTRGYAIAIVENNSQNGAYGGGNGVSAVTISDQAVINGPIAELQDSPRTSFSPTYTGNAVNKKVAAIGNDEYFTVHDAITIVPSQGTVKLLDNLTQSTLVMDVVKTYTLDLNGKTLTGNGCAALQITNGHVTLDGAAGSKVTVVEGTQTPQTAILMGSDAGNSRSVSLTINKDVTVDGGTLTSGVMLAGDVTRETLTVNGTVQATNHSAIIGSKEATKGGTTIHIAAGGTVKSTDAVAIYHPQSGDLLVDGNVIGVKNAGAAGAIEMKGGDLTVTSTAKITAAGTMNHTANAEAPSTNGYAIALVENPAFTGVGRVNISDRANVTGVIACLIDEQNNNVAEPLFTGDVYMIAETNINNGRGDKYAKLNDAITAAPVSTPEKESVVKLLDNLTVTTEAVAIVKAITLDMDDYSIINNINNQTTEGAVAMTISANATIKNGGIVSAKTGTPAVEKDNAGISVTAGTVTLQNMTVNTKGVSLSVSGGSVSADAKSSFSTSGSNTVVLSGGSLTMNGKVLNTATTSPAIAGTETGVLTVAATATVSSATSNAINWASTANLTISGGKIAGAEAVYAEKGTVTISGGTFTGTGNALNIAADAVTPSITGGTFYCGADNSYSPIKAVLGKEHFVSGTNTYFSKHIAQILCEDGYMVSQTPKNNGLFYLIDEIVINDGTQWSNGEDFKIKTATYIRNSGMGATGTRFGTLCLPFSFKPGDTKTTITAGMKFYKVVNINDAKSKITIAELTEEITAGTPVIFQFENAASDFTIKSKDATIVAGDAHSDNNLVGTFTKKELTTTSTPDKVDDVYFLNSDAFHQAKTSLTVPAFRAYIQPSSITGSTAKASVLNIHIVDEDEVDGIGSAQNDDFDVEAVYDLQGRKQNGLQKGMNIMKMSNGKTIKVYVNK